MAGGVQAGAEGAAHPRPPRVLGLVFLTAFLDLAGFSILFPLFPALLEHYVALEGPESFVGRVAARLAELAAGGGNGELLVHALFGGLLGSLYSLLQFAFAPIWGSVSDRYGRRPTLLVTLAGTAIAHTVWFFAGSFALLVLARLLGGVMAGNLATISAVVADTTSPEERPKGMGMLGAGIGLGFVLGPALGALSSVVDLREHWPAGTALGLNPFSAAALIATALAALNFLWALARFPETLPPERRGLRTSERSANPLVLFTGLPDRGVRLTNLLYFLYMVAFSAAEFTLVFLAAERFGFTPRDSGWLFVFIGVLIALVQGGLVRRVAPRAGERRIVSAGSAAVIASFAGVAFAASVPALYGALGLMAVGSAFLMPCLSSLVSRYAPSARQGLALGTFRSLGALARAIGPALGGTIYWRLGSQAPYLCGAALLLLPLFLSLGLPAPPGQASERP